ncbi:unnamed protein product [Acidocella sp. C78]|nr:unnamed protein product [Acidocella sp. C78]
MFHELTRPGEQLRSGDRLQQDGTASVSFISRRFTSRSWSIIRSDGVI